MNSGNMQLKSNVDFANVKSDIIIKKIFNVMEKTKSLKIMKYSKKLQKRFNLSIKDYKEYSLICSPIEIELKFDDEKMVNLLIYPMKIKNIIIFFLVIQMKK